jgi:transposase-like protein
MARKYQTYSKEFKLEAIRLAESTDKPITDLARELGIRVNQIYKWKQQLSEKQEDAFSGHGKQLGKDAEIARLKEELSQAREDNEILKKAAAYFAKALK